MKIYISADMEGVSGIANWDEMDRVKPDYQPFKEEMMNEVQAACEGANSAGAKEIFVRDAHCSARNLDFSKLPINSKLARVFSGHPFCMMEGLDKSFDAAMLTGYHASAGTDKNPLAHTMFKRVSYLNINGKLASEFLINAYTASLVGVPVVFVSGDTGICDYVKKINSNIKTVPLNVCHGSSVISFHPDLVYKKIKEGVESALNGNIGKCKIPLPKRFEVEISFVDQTKAYQSSFYPGMKKVSAKNLVFKTNDYFEVIRMLSFVL